jgi:hypothetical protein
MRLLHLYFGLFISPFVVVFAVSAMLVNHGWRPPKSEAKSRREVAIQIPQGLKGLVLAKEILRQANVSGEIEFFPADASGPRVWIPVVRPSRKITVDADLQAGTARIEERPVGLGERLIYLHKSPGPHNAAIRGNWALTRVWGVLADGTVYLLLLVSVTGVYIWLMRRGERKGGVLFLIGGCACFAAVLLILML